MRPISSRNRNAPIPVTMPTPTARSDIPMSPYGGTPTSQPGSGLVTGASGPATATLSGGASSASGFKDGSGIVSATLASVLYAPAP